MEIAEVGYGTAGASGAAGSAAGASGTSGVAGVSTAGVSGVAGAAGGVAPQPKVNPNMATITIAKIFFMGCILLERASLSPPSLLALMKGFYLPSPAEGSMSSFK
jgi:hypothetical protein